MTSLILSTATRFLLPLLLLFSISVLLRGHNDPGGGFIGGLIAAGSFALAAIAFGVRRSRRTLRANPRTLIAIGLLTALGSGTFGLVGGRPFMSAYWVLLEIPIVERLAVGTPFLFDCGVYLVVLGVTMTIIFSLAEES